MRPASPNANSAASVSTAMKAKNHAQNVLLANSSFRSDQQNVHPVRWDDTIPHLDLAPIAHCVPAVTTRPKSARPPANSAQSKRSSSLVPMLLAPATNAGSSQPTAQASAAAAKASASIRIKMARAVAKHVPPGYAPTPRTTQIVSAQRRAPTAPSSTSPT